MLEKTAQFHEETCTKEFEKACGVPCVLRDIYIAKWDGLITLHEDQETLLKKVTDNMVIVPYWAAKHYHLEWSKFEWELREHMAWFKKNLQFEDTRLTLPTELFFVLKHFDIMREDLMEYALDQMCSEKFRIRMSEIYQALEWGGEKRNRNRTVTEYRQKAGSMRDQFMYPHRMARRTNELHSDLLEKRIEAAEDEAESKAKDEQYKRDYVDFRLPSSPPRRPPPPTDKDVSVHRGEPMEPQIRSRIWKMPNENIKRRKKKMP